MVTGAKGGGFAGWSAKSSSHPPSPMSRRSFGDDEGWEEELLDFFLVLFFLTRLVLRFGVEEAVSSELMRFDPFPKLLVVALKEGSIPEAAIGQRTIYWMKIPRCAGEAITG